MPVTDTETLPEALELPDSDFPGGAYIDTDGGSMGTIVLLDLIGGVALLLWGLHMVQSGIMRAFGPDLRRVLSKALRNRLAAFGAGLGLTALLQSSTATGLMTASFAAEAPSASSPHWRSCWERMSGRP